MSNVILNGIADKNQSKRNPTSSGIQSINTIDNGIKSVICGLDPTTDTSIPIKVNSSGELEMTAEIDSSGLATSANQTNGTQEAKCMGNDSGVSQKQILVSNTGVVQTLDSEVFGKTSQIANQTTLSNVNEATLIANQTNDTQSARCMGINGTTQTQLAVEANGSLVIGGGAVKTAVSSVDSSTQHIIVDANGHLQVELPNRLGQKANASSISTCRSSTTGAYDLSARTTISGGGSSATSTKLLCDASGILQVNDTSGGGGGSSSNTYSNVPVSVLAPVAPATQAITTSGNIELTNARNITITLYSVELSSALLDIDKVALEYSYDGTNFFTDLSSASQPNFQTTVDIEGNTRFDPALSGNPVLIDGSTLFPDVDKAKFVRVVFLHDDASGLGQNLAVIPIIVLNGL